MWEPLPHQRKPSAPLQEERPETLERRGLGLGLPEKVHWDIGTGVAGPHTETLRMLWRSEYSWSAWLLLKVPNVSSHGPVTCGDWGRLSFLFFPFFNEVGSIGSALGWRIELSRLQRGVQERQEES